MVMHWDLTTPLRLPDTPPEGTTSRNYTPIPRLIYGTAWKKDETEDLVFAALLCGFKAIDTAAQPKHYREDLVARGIRTVFECHSLAETRQNLFIQTKFTPLDSQDPNDMPYDKDAPLEEQIKQSVDSSLKTFRTSRINPSKQRNRECYLDCLVLHTPLPTLEETKKAWDVLATYVPHKVRHLGISNTSLLTLEYLFDQYSDRPHLLPAVVQNRLEIPSTSASRSLLSFCRDKGIIFQAFSVLTAGRSLLTDASVRRLADGAGVTREAALYALMLGVESKTWTVINGTTDMGRMYDDLLAMKTVEDWTKTSDGASCFKDALVFVKGVLGVD